jgi:hypothetical protein
MSILITYWINLRGYIMAISGAYILDVPAFDH